MKSLVRFRSQGCLCELGAELALLHTAPTVAAFSITDCRSVLWLGLLAFLRIRLVLIVEARKLEHHYPHALKVKYKGS